MAGKNEEVLKEAFMTKRSQNKRSFTPTNWKERWFVLSPENLIYYDGDRQVSERSAMYGCSRTCLTDHVT